MSINPEDLEFLEHYGVKGMKWGVRKDRSGRTSRQANRARAKKRRLEGKEHREGKRATRKANRRQMIREGRKDKTPKRKRTAAEKRADRNSKLILGTAGLITTVATASIHREFGAPLVASGQRAAGRVMVKSALKSLDGIDAAAKVGKRVIGR